MLGQITVFSVNPVVALYIQHMIGDGAYLATFVGASFAVVGIADLMLRRSWESAATRSATGGCC